jgi:hypothetical protein
MTSKMCMLNSCNFIWFLSVKIRSIRKIRVILPFYLLLSLPETDDNDVRYHYTNN